MIKFKELIEDLGNPIYNPNEQNYDKYTPKKYKPQYVNNIRLHKKPELTPDEKNSIDHYTKAGYVNMNKFHRGEELHDFGPAPMWAEHSDLDKIEERSAHLDSAIAKHTTNVPIHVWRGIDDDAVKKLKLGKNKIIHDPGYVSTSVSQNIASTSFKNPVRDQHHIMSIRVPKGSKAVYMNQHSKRNVDEHEVLLPRGSKFRYSHTTEHTHKYGYPVFVHHLEHIPEKS
jgi:hypothetical protein